MARQIGTQACLIFTNSWSWRSSFHILLKLALSLSLKCYKILNPFAPARRFAVAELWRFLVALFIDRFRPFFFWSLQHTLICLATLLPHPTRVRLLLQSAGNMAGRRWGSITTFSVTKWPLNLLQKIRFLFCSIYKHSESSQHSFCCKKIKTIAIQGV